MFALIYVNEPFPSGSENYLQRNLERLLILICDFDMAWYPFDRQVCTLELLNDEESVELIMMKLTYTGLKVC